MKHILKVALLLCSSLQSASMLCGQSLPSSLIAWKGEWITERPGGTIHERWTIVENKVMQGSSWLIKANADSAYQESIKLYAESDSVIYCSPFVPGQHNAPVPFRLIRQGDSEWLFHNAENDFPKYIGYQMFNYDRLKARIGNDSTFTEKPFVIFDFRKIK